MTFFRSTVAWTNQFLDREVVTPKNWCTPNVTFDNTGPKTWSVVSCGPVATLV